MELINGANYYEIYLINKNQNKIIKNSCEIYNISLDEQDFYNILSKIDQKKFKFFQKEYKEYINQEHICNIFTNDETRVYDKKNINIIEKEKFITIASNLNKLTLLNFSSTKNHNKISFVKKLIFRITNRIYLNFEISINTLYPKNKIYTIYINYNHDDTVDINIINKNINDIVRLITNQKN